MNTQASGPADVQREAAAGPDTTFDPLNGDRLLTPGEVAALFRLTPKTIGRWAANGWIVATRTPGGHRRYRESEVRALLDCPADVKAGHPR